MCGSGAVTPGTRMRTRKGEADRGAGGAWRGGWRSGRSPGVPGRGLPLRALGPALRVSLQAPRPRPEPGPRGPRGRASREPLSRLLDLLARIASSGEPMGTLQPSVMSRDFWRSNFRTVREAPTTHSRARARPTRCPLASTSDQRPATSDQRPTSRATVSDHAQAVFVEDSGQTVSSGNGEKFGANKIFG